MKQKNSNLLIALEATRAAAKIVSENFGKLIQSKVKDNAKGLVTQTDLEAEQAILSILQSQSGYRILSEEAGSTGKKDGPVWVVDPLDGTNNFTYSLPFFAVSVALMNGSESQLGVIIDPLHNKEYCAIKGGGTFCNGNQISLPEFRTDYMPTIFLNHGYPESDRTKFKKLTNRLAADNNILKLGTTALELCFVASGSADAFICSGDELWDFAAGIVIAKEAGITFTDWKGNPWDGKGNHLLFAKPEIHQKLVAQIKDLQ